MKKVEMNTKMSDHTEPLLLGKKKRNNYREDMLKVMQTGDEKNYEKMKDFTDDQWEKWICMSIRGKELMKRSEERKLFDLSHNITSNDIEEASTFNPGPFTSTDTLYDPSNINSHNQNTLNIKTSEDKSKLNKKSSIVNYGSSMNVGSFFNNSGIINVDQEGNVINTGSASITQTYNTNGAIQVTIQGPISPPLPYDYIWIDDYSEPIQILECGYDGKILTTHVTNHCRSNNFTTSPECLKLSISGNLMDTTIIIHLSIMGDSIFITYKRPIKEKKEEILKKREIENKMKEKIERKRNLETKNKTKKKKQKTEEEKEEENMQNCEEKSISGYFKDGNLLPKFCLNNYATMSYDYTHDLEGYNRLSDDSDL